MPNASLETLLNAFEKQSMNLDKNDTAILLIGDYNRHTAKDYDSYPEMLQKKLKLHFKFKLVVCSLSYDGYNDNQIYSINKRLHHLAVVNGCMKYLDINCEHSFKKVTKAASLITKITYCLQNYQNTSSLHFINCNQNSDENFEAKKDFQRFGLAKGPT